MEALRDFELRIVRSEYRELRLWNDKGNFVVGKGTAASTERWYFYTPAADHYGDSLEEVVQHASQTYPQIRAWLEKFNTR